MHYGLFFFYCYDFSEVFGGGVCFFVIPTPTGAAGGFRARRGADMPQAAARGIGIRAVLLSGGYGAAADRGFEQATKYGAAATLRHRIIERRSFWAHLG